MSAYVRDDGTTDPTIAGYAKFNGLPINDGTFKSANLGMLTSSPPILDAAVSLPNDDGGFDGFPLYDRWQFPIDGWFLVDTVDYVHSAEKDLRSALNLYAGTQIMQFKARDFDQMLRMSVRLDGQIIVNDPGFGVRKMPRRDFTIPLLAVDPRAYNDDSEHSVDLAVGATHTLTNDGNYPTPFAVTFVGPLTSPQLDGPGSGIAGFNRIRLLNADSTDYVIGSGHSVTVQTNPSTPGAGVTAVDETGASVYAKVANRSASLVTPGSSSWVFTTNSGADTGHATVVFRDAWV